MKMKVPHPHLTRKHAIMMVIATYSVVMMTATAYEWALPYVKQWMN